MLLGICGGSVSGLAGCVLDPGQTPTVTFHGEGSVTESGQFVLDGRVTTTQARLDTEFRDLHVCLYGSSGDRVYEERMGDLSGALPVTVSVSGVPELVVFHSPDFYGADIWYAYYRIEETESGVRLVARRVSSPPELPVDPEETGCGS